MTHERQRRPTGRAGGPEHDTFLPDARDIPVVATAAERLLDDVENDEHQDYGDFGDEPEEHLHV